MAVDPTMGVEATASAPIDRTRSSALGPGFGRFVLGKLGGAAISLVMVILSGFFIFRVLGGDPVAAILGDSIVSPEQKAALRRELHLDEPLMSQFLAYFQGVLQGDLGTSYQYREPVWDLIMTRLPATLLLTGTAMVVSVALGLWVGTRAGWRRGSTYDQIHVGVALTLWSAPTFWFGLIIIMVFGTILPIFPVNGMVYSDTPPDFLSQSLDALYHLVLPVITMTAVVYAQYALVMRSSILDEMGNDYLTTARAKGLRDDLVRRRHAVPNALLPTMTLIFMHLGGLVGGAILTESVFSWPGLGTLTFEAIKIPDIPILQGTFVFFSTAVILANAVADILYRFLDPRVRQS